MATEHFTSQEASDRLGISLRQLQHWDALGIASPSIEAATGSGSRRRYSEDDLLRLAIVRELRALSVGLDTIRAILAAVAHLEVRCPEATRLVWSAGGDVYLGDETEDITRAVAAHTASLEVGVGRLAATVRSQLRVAPPQKARGDRKVRARAARPAAPIDPRLPSAGAAAWGESW